MVAGDATTEHMYYLGRCIMHGKRIVIYDCYYQ